MCKQNNAKWWVTPARVAHYYDCFVNFIFYRSEAILLRVSIQYYCSSSTVPFLSITLPFLSMPLIIHT